MSPSKALHNASIEKICFSGSVQDSSIFGLLTRLCPCPFLSLSLFIYLFFKFKKNIYYYYFFFFINRKVVGQTSSSDPMSYIVSTSIYVLINIDSNIPSTKELKRDQMYQK
jgi:hypothetical protein